MEKKIIYWLKDNEGNILARYAEGDNPCEKTKELAYKTKKTITAYKRSFDRKSGKFWMESFMTIEPRCNLLMDIGAGFVMAREFVTYKEAKEQIKLIHEVLKKNVPQLKWKMERI